MLRFIFLLLTLCCSVTIAQVKCWSCSQEITGSYFEVEGKYFHPEHFTCSECGKAIPAGFSKLGDKFLHPACYAQLQGLICEACNKTLLGSFVTVEGRKYHKVCYEGSVARKCDICNTIISGTYTTDVYGNTYHAAHLQEFKKCDNCSRIICQQITRGGKKYSDGRNICNLCFTNAVSDDATITSLANEVQQQLKLLKFTIDISRITFVGVDQNKLRSLARDRFSSSMRGLCVTNISKFTLPVVGGHKTTEKKTYTVYVLNGVPALDLSATIAHELMHVWLSEMDRYSHPLTEGMCNFLAFRYLQQLNTPEALLLSKRYDDDPDPEYGDGFRKIKTEFEHKAMHYFLDYAAGR